MAAPSMLPTLNAALNLSAAVLLGAGFYFIRRKNIPAHKACMMGALGVSAIFLISYVIYHASAGSVPFEKQGWIRSVYFAILITHILLAIVILPMALRSAFLGLRLRFAEHRRIARWTFPIWMYVSITGVIVYVMLYRL
jgi:putative membrane protein